MKRTRGRVAAGVAGTALLLGAVACRPLTAEPLQPLPIGNAILVRINDADIASGAVKDPNVPAGTLRFHPVRVDVRTGSVQTLPDPGTGSLNATVDTEPGSRVSVGFVTSPAGDDAALWDPAHGDVLESIPDLGGGSQAAAINGHGVIVGQSASATSADMHAVRYDRGTGTVADLGTLGGATSAAVGISEDGVVAGQSALADGTKRGFFLDPAHGSLTALPSAPGFANQDVEAIDDGGTLIVGGAATAAPTSPFAQLAMIYDRGTGEVTTIDPFGGRYADATDVDERGIVVGTSRTTGGEDHGFAYDTRTRTVVDLGTISGRVTFVGINDHLRVAGWDFDYLPRPQVLTAFTTVLHTSPDAPAAPLVSGCGGTATVSWHAPAFDGNDPVTSYVVQRDGQTVATVAADVSAIVEAVPVGTTAHFTVSAVNTDGASENGPTTTFTSAGCGT